MKAVIIAGGLGTRLRPLTYNTPKPIVPVANRPFVVHQIEFLKQHGITEIILNLHYLPEAIKKVLGDGADFGVKLHYSLEISPLGTAGAVKNAEEFFDGEPLVVFNGDVLTDINITKVIAKHKEKKAKATLTLTSVPDPTAFGLVLTDADGRVKEFLEKPSWTQLEGQTKFEINAGIYILDPSVFKKVPKNTRSMFEHDLFPRLLADGDPVYAYASDRFWLDIGNIQKYRYAHEAILRGEVAVRIIGTRVQGGYWVAETAIISNSAKVYGPSLIGEGAQVGESAAIKEYSVVGDKTKIGDNATIETSIIWSNAVIGRNVKLINCVVGANCIIDDNCELKNAVIADGSHVTRGSTL